jgi:aminoglycoside phosphotransferase (APT) family kinase protein
MESRPGTISEQELRALDFGHYCGALSGLRLSDLRIDTRNSTIFRGVVPSSGLAVAVKCVGSAERARVEFDSLSNLLASLPDSVRVVQPICLLAEYGLVVVEWIDGRSVHDYLATPDSDFCGICEVLSATGRWLRAFHDASKAAPKKVDFSKKMIQLDDLCRAASRGKGSIALLRWMRRRLRSSYPTLAALQLPEGRLHGDCKPENLIIERDHVVAIDVGHVYKSTTWNDVAYFLVHLEWTVLTSRQLGRIARLARLRAAFLDAYDDDRRPEVAGLIAWLEMEVLYRFAFHHLSRQKVGISGLTALLAVSVAFIMHDLSLHTRR